MRTDVTKNMGVHQTEFMAVLVEGLSDKPRRKERLTVSNFLDTNKKEHWNTLHNR